MSESVEASAEELALFARFRTDFPFYAPRALRIRTKKGQIMPFKLNQAQMLLHEAIEKQRAETGKVRVVVLKGRQQGISTYAEGRFFWRVTHGRGMRAFILTHLDDATNNLFNMASRFYEHCPPELRPTLGASNAKELAFAKLDSGYKVGTAGSKGVGRSDTFQLFHGSEVGLWANAAEHVAGAMQAVADADGTEVILESTSQGPQGAFYDMCMSAMSGETDYRLVFVPWFLQDEYRRPVNPEFVMTSEELDYAAQHKLVPEQIAWRRAKIRDFGGLHHFRREYPATVAEAFKNEALGALWSRELLERCRAMDLPEMTRIVVAVDPSGSRGKPMPVPGDAERMKGAGIAGIVAVGLGVDGRGYVLADRSGAYTPDGWAREAVRLYHALHADRIVAERNFGGDMVRATIESIDGSVSYKDVVASRGKQQRAEPILALYERGQVMHAGILPALEDEMTSWEPGRSAWSPNRVDAAVWGLTELLLDGGPNAYDASLRWATGQGGFTVPPSLFGP